MSDPTVPSPPISIRDEAASFLNWCRSQPAEFLLLLSSLGTLIFFYGYLPLCAGHHSVAVWAWQAWNPDMNQEHSKLVPLIAIGLLFYHYEALKKARKEGSARGLIFLLIGLLLFILSVRCLQPRLSLLSIPFILYGGARYLWGAQVARIIRFPCAFLIFMVPSAVLEQSTFNLQKVVTGSVGFLSNLIGIHVLALGTTLSSADGSFQFEIVEGCSGIRSLIAMTMLTAVYVHLTQREIWRKGLILAASVIFAVIGNIGRILSIILAAKFLDPHFPDLIPKLSLLLAKVAGSGVIVQTELPSEFIHEWSGFVFFPIALLAMVGFGRLLEMDFKKAAQAVAVKEEPERVSYDY